MSELPRRPRAAWRRWLIRAAGSGFLLATLFWFLPGKAIAEGLSKVPLILFALVLLAFLAGHMVAACKWWLLLDRRMPFGLALRAHFAGLASNLLLPGVAGGDAVRAGMAQLAIRDGAHVAVGAVADRMIDMLALASLSLVGVLMINGEGANLAVQVVAVMLFIVVSVVYLAPVLVSLAWRIFPSLPGQRLSERVASALRTLGRRPLLLLVAFALSAIVQGAFILLAFQFANAVGVGVDLGAWVFSWPLAKILAVLPISLGGLGVREASLAALLTPFGANAAQVVAAGLVWQAVLFVTGAFGASVLAATGYRVTPVAGAGAEDHINEKVT